MRIDVPHAPAAKRTPRQPEPWPYDVDELFVGLVVVPMLFYTIGVIVYHADLYEDAGAGPMDGPGAVAGQLVVLAVLLGAATLYRWGHRLRTVFAVAGTAGVLAVAFALLPHLAAGKGWLQTLLGVLFAVPFNALIALAVGLVARHLPMWWTGWLRRVGESNP